MFTRRLHVVIQVCGQARWRTLNILPAVKIKTVNHVIARLECT